MDFFAKNFSQLTTTELYEIIKSRDEVFLLEQKIICMDLDDLDYQSLHCFLYDGKRVTAYLRAFSVGADEVIVGRVLTLTHQKGLGRILMEQSLEAIKQYFLCRKIIVHAQKQAMGFYEKMGFSTVSDEYLEQGIVHVTMERSF